MGTDRFSSSGASFVHPMIVAAVALAVILILCSPRKRAILPFLAAGILIPMDQVIVVGGLHFQMIRILILAGWVMVLRYRVSYGLNLVDVALLLSTLIAAVDILILFQDSAALTNQLGNIYTVFGIYFLLRFLIRSIDDLIFATKCLAFISAFVAVVMLIEQVMHHNPYAYVWAAASEDGRTVMIRDGHFRAMACFAHPILAGTFGGISLPLFFALWWKDQKHRKIAILGAIACTVIILTANSSTPLLAYCGGLLALAMWPMRKYMRVFRWSLLILLTTLHLLMKAPVWALIARIDLTGSSSGYHRYQLVDQFIRRFQEWWLVGTKDNANWGWDMWDLANQYVAVGVTSGLLPFLCFIAIIVFGFKYIGKARKAAKNRADEHFIWAMGAALFANVVAFFGISYYDQTMVAWYLLLAIIPAACASVHAEAKKAAVQSNQQLPVVPTHALTPSYSSQSRKRSFYSPAPQRRPGTETL